MVNIPTTKVPRPHHVTRQQWLTRKARGIDSIMVPADKVQTHIRRLREAGMSYSAIAEQAGVSNSTVSKIDKGTRDQVHPRTAALVLRVPYVPKEIADNRHIPAVGSQRRIQALMRVGHSRKRIAEEAGLPNGTVCHVSRPEVKTVEAETHHKIRKAYEKLSMIKGESKATAGRAERAGYPSPWDWETARLDDPNSWPAALPKPVSAAEATRAQGMALLSMGFTQKEVAKRVGVAERSVARWSITMKKEAIDESERVQPSSRSLELVA